MRPPRTSAFSRPIAATGQLDQRLQRAQALVRAARLPAPLRQAAVGAREHRRRELAAGVAVNAPRVDVEVAGGVLFEAIGEARHLGKCGTPRPAYHAAVTTVGWALEAIAAVALVVLVVVRLVLWRRRRPRILVRESPGSATWLSARGLATLQSRMSRADPLVSGIPYTDGFHLYPPASGAGALPRRGRRGDAPPVRRVLPGAARPRRRARPCGARDRARSLRPRRRRAARDPARRRARRAGRPGPLRAHRHRRLRRRRFPVEPGDRRGRSAWRGTGSRPAAPSR